MSAGWKWFNTCKTILNTPQKFLNSGQNIEYRILPKYHSYVVWDWH